MPKESPKILGDNAMLRKLEAEFGVVIGIRPSTNSNRYSEPYNVILINIVISNYNELIYA